MQIHITLGSVSTNYPIDARSAQLIIDKPDHIFQAANRIQELKADLAYLEMPNASNPSLVELLIKIRSDIDQFQMTSMSPGDSFELRDQNGYLIGKWDAKSTGWGCFINRELLELEVNVIA